MNKITKYIIKNVAQLGRTVNFIPLHAPIFEGNEIEYVTDCIKSNFVSSVGEYVNKFEKAICKYTGAKYAILTVNGTAALHVSLLLAGVGENDEVLMPALTFIATANAVSYIKAIPHFIDVEEKSLGIDADKLDEYLHTITLIENGVCINKNTKRKIKAIVPMHTFGHPVDMDKLKKVAEKYNLEIVEDAAESLGSFYKGVHTGNIGKLAAISFNGNKIITTGGGGCILTNDEELAKKAKHITTTAKVPHPWEYEHDMIGYNYRMPALNAALGLAQIEKLSEFIEKKRRLAKKYKEIFDDFKEFTFFTEPDYAKSNYWLNAIVLNKGYEHLRDEILKETNENGIMTRPVWKLIHHLKMFKNCPRMDLSVSESLEKRVINIPSSAYLGE
ncbi:LegC family aminotransferase [Nitratiruptor sp. YY09-18]|uniref:LegC family aminotransferase n=1 Tax=Nitratiruptor sp. YY09-18 TaxID=2724901 RepID=UPI0019159392|nr:LegC family aminotransferase [Nitratiruptor sp. YY09-18]BCD67957.1 perosamine synthetase [Nitratiruptor sp. YY09-18]